jgi:hypothetical protein
MEWEREKEWKYAYNIYLNSIPSHMPTHTILKYKRNKSTLSSTKNASVSSSASSSTLSEIPGIPETSHTSKIFETLSDVSTRSSYSNPELFSFNFFKNISYELFLRRTNSVGNISNTTHIQNRHPISIDKVIIGSIVFQIYNRCFCDKFKYPPLVFELGLHKHHIPITQGILMKRRKLYKRLKSIYFDPENILPLIGREYILHKDPNYLEAFIVACIVRIFHPYLCSITQSFKTVHTIPNITDYNVILTKEIINKWLPVKLV